MQKELIILLKNLKIFLSENFKKYNNKLPYIITTLIATILVIAGTKLFIKLTKGLKSEFLATFDATISEVIVGYRNPFLTKYFLFVTNLGDTLGYLIVFTVTIFLFYIILKSWKYLAQITLVMVLALSSNMILKQIINRARPVTEHLVTVKTLSYPSGHAMMAMAFYGFLIYLFFTLKMHKSIKVILIILCAILILSIGISRIYLGVHYPSDVVGGFIAGFIWIVFCVLIFNLLKIFRRDSET